MDVKSIQNNGVKQLGIIVPSIKQEVFSIKEDFY
jgi:hypothetical protein